MHFFLIHWLPLAIMAIEPMEWLTIGLLIFAGVQVLVPIWSERRRVAERKQDELRLEAAHVREMDHAFQLAWAEQFRLDQLAGQWSSADLLHLSALGVLDPTAVLPRDWSLLMAALAQLSVEAGFLGGVALTLGHDIAQQVALFNGMIRDVAHQFPGSTPADVASRARGLRPELTEMESKLKQTTNELALLLWDAARHSPRADVERMLDFRDDLKSDFGRVAIGALKWRKP